MRSATACVTQLEFITKTWKEWFTYAANTFPRAVHALTHTSPNLFYPIVRKLIMSNNYSAVKPFLWQYHKCCPVRLLCSAICWKSPSHLNTGSSPILLLLNQTPLRIFQCKPNPSSMPDITSLHQSQRNSSSSPLFTQTMQNFNRFGSLILETILLFQCMPKFFEVPSLITLFLTAASF